MLAFSPTSRFEAAAASAARPWICAAVAPVMRATCSPKSVSSVERRTAPGLFADAASSFAWIAARSAVDEVFLEVQAAPTRVRANSPAIKGAVRRTRVLLPAARPGTTVHPKALRALCTQVFGRL